MKREDIQGLDVIQILKIINDLEADRLEMAKAIVETDIDFHEDNGYCHKCNQDTDVDFPHKEDCIVLKAQNIIKESK